MSTGIGLESLVDQTISVITNDGRNIVGVLKGFDQATNIILDESHERVFSTKGLMTCEAPFPFKRMLIFERGDHKVMLIQCYSRCPCKKMEGVQQLVLGLYIIRGDNISVIGELDEELDASLDFSKLRAHPLKPVVH
ncbi:PREDICTED: sm-like protein LSM8 isoform X1 [Tarenaya hassleriana]|uniref:sm-like protein LSM8 isoform X1 n=1 Tax=Tarenaya hassleriana TaxID=28532 RepID=UPI00053C7C2B|nr:PREDICTED: sm-like protein LSM8 isoform X1 [Tarenaya hassleriana]XP_010528615.1 PREDICTED: sm-like protein LSM8 isoform X1 [Tarenaya hassleriana]